MSHLITLFVAGLLTLFTLPPGLAAGYYFLGFVLYYLGAAGGCLIGDWINKE